MKPIPYKKVSKDILAILDLVSKGEEIVIRNEHNQENIAVIIPYAKYRRQYRKKRKLGILKGKAGFRIKDDFAITDEELLTL
ncbi:MAG: type II toxin-antitoxin system Phd/YefM family antitoxin [Candidatus Electrothrix sp. YB6]